jgi:hypothetical protein
MLDARRERRTLFRADFIGRFDVAAFDTSAGKRGTSSTFGKSATRTRLVLQGIENAETIDVPRR